MLAIIIAMCCECQRAPICESLIISSESQQSMNVVMNCFVARAFAVESSRPCKLELLLPVEA